MTFGTHKRNVDRSLKGRGFSLVEVLVYLAVVVLVAVAGVNTFFSLHTVLYRNQTERVLTEAAQVSLERMVRDIRAADTADVTIPSQLTLATVATTTVFSVSGGQVMLNINGADEGGLTGSNVKVNSLSFTKYEYPGAELVTTLVRVKLTLSISTREASSTRTYYTSAVLRGTYE